MTYCVAMRLDAGLVFLGDSRTNAGVDQISTFRKLTVFEHLGERVLVLMSAGNLAVTQAVRQILCERIGPTETSVWNVKTMFHAVRILGEAIREVHERDAESLKEFGIEFNANFILGGQIRGEGLRLFQVYSAGNFIEATHENPYFQIGESKYGKPIIDRVVQPKTPLDEAAKAALISMDSTLRSNISVGLPLDLLVIGKDEFSVTHAHRVTEDDAYFDSISSGWGNALRAAFHSLPPYRFSGDA